MTQEQNEIWSLLFNRQLKNIERHACSEYRQGLDRIAFNPGHIPTIVELNEKLGGCGWTITNTRVRYLSALQWARFIGKGKFPVTTYLRGKDELDFTPEPDMFHDIFGHLPFLLHEDTLRLVNVFAKKMLTADRETIEKIVAKLWWFTIEFGLIRENGEIKALGAGLMSSFGELRHSTDRNVHNRDFTIEAAIQENPAVYSFHNGYFIVDSVAELAKQLEEYFKTI